MFHLELRRFPYVARAFNLSEQELRATFLIPWVRGEPVTLDDRRFDPDRARLTVIEGPEVPTEERGLGRGWSAVTREGSDVTAKLLDALRDQLEAEGPAAALRELKARLLSMGTLPIARVVALAPQRLRVSERLALSERAVWELLHAGEVALVRNGEPVSPEQWQPLLFDWGSWTDERSDLYLAERDTK